MQQIADWLKKLGMSEYAQRFAENGINFPALRHLTDQDLKDIGVLSVIGGSCSRQSPSWRRSRYKPEHPAHEPKAQDTAERRQVTVMFSDLVGSTALSARMDPEDLREVISAYQKCVAETVQRFGGFVAKFMGDGVSSTSAIRKRMRTTPSERCGQGLKLIAAVSELKSPVPLQTRVGIATGWSLLAT